MLTVWALMIFTDLSLPSATIFRSLETCQQALRETVQYIKPEATALCVESVIPAGLAMRGRR